MPRLICTLVMTQITWKELRMSEFSMFTAVGVPLGANLLKCCGRRAWRHTRQISVHAVDARKSEGVEIWTPLSAFRHSAGFLLSLPATQTLEGIELAQRDV